MAREAHVPGEGAGLLGLGGLSPGHQEREGVGSLDSRLAEPQMRRQGNSEGREGDTFGCWFIPL